MPFILLFLLLLLQEISSQLEEAVTAGAGPTHACNGLGKTSVAWEAKLKFFYHRRGKELEDIPVQGIPPPFPCLKYHRRWTEGKQKTCRFLGRNLAMGLLTVGDGAFLCTTWRAGTGKGLAQASGRRGCARPTQLLLSLWGALSRPTYLWHQQTLQKHISA